jgi:glyoxylase-like metal-dependent hydrolase (beta-lactamase superfamily II)
MSDAARSVDKAGEPVDKAGEPAECVQVAPGNYVIRTREYLLNSGLVVGRNKALVVDTGAGPRQARRIYAAVRALTKLPLVVVNTHFHYDHVFGNAYFAAQGVQDFYAHRNCAHDIAENGVLQREAVGETEPEMAAADGEYTGIKMPNKLVDAETIVDLGEVSVKLFHLGRGHTDGDLLVGSPATLFAGDLVEQGAPPAFEDSYPRDWVETLRRISGLRHEYDVLVPGHGQTVSDAFVKNMCETMTLAVRMGEQASRDTPADSTKAIPILPYGPVQSRALLQRLTATR